MVSDATRGRDDLPRLEDLVRDEQNRSFFTDPSHGLQVVNQITLRDELVASGVVIPRGNVLDVGGGDGLFLALRPYIFPSHMEMNRRTVILFDLVANKVMKAREVASAVAIEYTRRTTTPDRPHGYSLRSIVADPLNIANPQPEKIYVDGKLVEAKKVDGAFVDQHWEHGRSLHVDRAAIIWSNSMFHWVRSAREKYDAIAHFFSWLQGGGILAMSMSARGTGKDFLIAYNNVMRTRVGRFDIIDNPLGYKNQLFEKDPIGSVNLDEMVEILEESGFEIVSANSKWERKDYETPRLYSDTAWVYGRDAFLASVHHYHPKEKEELWEVITQEFEDILKKSHKWTEGKPWTYAQYNHYIIARRRKEEAPRLAQPVREQPVFSLMSYLNMRYLTGRYGTKPGISIGLSGNSEAISGQKTHAPLEGILDAVIDYAAKERSSELEAKPKGAVDYARPDCSIIFTVVDGKLIIDFDIEVKKPRQPMDLFRSSFYANLEKLGVVSRAVPLESGLRRYEFEIPLIRR